jgi:hypothetical protein
MRDIVGIAGSMTVLLAVAFLGGCSPSQRVKTQTPSDVFGVMDKELSHSLVGKADAFDAMDTELAHAIGTTSLTSETLPSAELAPMPLPESRMSLAEELKATQTWGAGEEPLASEAPTMVSEIDPSEIPSTRE